MALENMIHFLYIIPLIICLRTFQVSIDYYDRLPDTFPMHFNIKGQADKWWKKSRLSVYLMPIIGAGTVLMMWGILLFICHKSGPLPDDFNFAWLFFTFSLAYMFYKTQTGIIQYVLNKIKTIWPFMGKGLFFVVISSVLLILIPYIPMKPTISNAIMCTGVTNKKPMDIRSVFYMDDPNAILFLTLQNIKGKHLIRTEWINPEGNEHFVYESHTHHKIFAKYLPWWSYIHINKNKDNIVPGDWRVDVYIDNEKTLTQTFVISAEPETGTRL